MKAEDIISAVARASTSYFGFEILPEHIISGVKGEGSRRYDFVRNVARILLFDSGFDALLVSQITNCDRSTVHHAVRKFRKPTPQDKKYFDGITKLMSIFELSTITADEYIEQVGFALDNIIEFVDSVSHSEIAGWVRKRLIDELKELKLK